MRVRRVDEIIPPIIGTMRDAVEMVGAAAF